jgi:hypothetical protein
MIAKYSARRRNKKSAHAGDASFFIRMPSHGMIIPIQGKPDYRYCMMQLWGNKRLSRTYSLERMC